MAVIEDGKGSSRKATVDSEGRLHVHATSEDEQHEAVEKGTSWNINTGSITLTSGNKSSLLYVRNTGEDNLYIDTFIWLLGNSTGAVATEDCLVQVYRNPTAGTLISGGTVLTPSNRNYGSANILDATVLKGVEGSTITDGTVSIESIFNSSGRKVVVVPIILPTGASMAASVTPFTTNSNMDVQLAIAVHTSGE